MGLGLLLLDRSKGFFGSIDLVLEDVVVFLEVFCRLCPMPHRLCDKVPPFAVELQPGTLSFCQGILGLWRDFAVLRVACTFNVVR